MIDGNKEVRKQFKQFKRNSTFLLRCDSYVKLTGETLGKSITWHFINLYKKYHAHTCPKSLHGVFLDRFSLTLVSLVIQICL